jgi:hypothetical protein
MPTFGSGPGQYQSQTTFSPVFQPTIQTIQESKQNLFSQLAGIIPSVARSAADVINATTESKINSYKEREAAAKLEAFNNDDLGILENFYQSEISTTGIQPPSIRNAATEGFIGVKQTINKYNEELQKSIARDQESADKEKSQNEMKQLRSTLAYVEQGWKLNKNWNVASEQYNELNKQFKNNPDALTMITNSFTEFGLAIQKDVDSKIEEANTAKIKTETEADQLAKQSAELVKDSFTNNPNTKRQIRMGGPEQTIFLMGKALQETNPDPSIVWDSTTGLTVNRPEINAAIIKQATIISYGFNDAIYKEALNSSMEDRLRNLSNAAATSPTQFLEAFRNSLQFGKSLDSNNQVQYFDKVEQTLNKTITSLSESLTESGTPQDIVKVATDITTVFNNTMGSGFRLGASTNESFNQVKRAGSNILTNTVFADLSQTMPQVKSSESAKEWLVDSNGKPTNITFGDFALIQRLSEMVDSETGNKIFSEEDINKILVTGDYASAFSREKKGAKDLILVAAIEAAKNFRGTENTDKNGKPRIGVTTADILDAQRRGVALSPKQFDSLTSPSEQTRDPIIVSKGISGLETIQLSDKTFLTPQRISELVNSRDPKDIQSQFELFGILGAQDLSFLNGTNPTMQQVTQVAQDLNSSNQSEVIRGIALFHSYGGFKNPTIRDYLNNPPQGNPTLSDQQLVQLAHVSEIVKDNKLTVPNGLNLFQYLDQVSKSAEEKGSQRQSIKISTTDMLDELEYSGIALTSTQLQFIKAVYESNLSLYPNSNAAAVTKQMVQKNGMVVVNQPDGSKSLYLDPYNYYVEEKDRPDLLLRTFTTVIPDFHKDAYRKYFDIRPEQKFNTFGDLLVAKLSNRGVTSYSDLLDLDWNLSFDEDNFLTFFETAPGNMSPSYQLERGGILQFWNENDKVWESIFGKNDVEIRLTRNSLLFPETAKMLGEEGVKNIVVGQSDILNTMNPATVARSRAAAAALPFGRGRFPVVKTHSR